MIVLAAADRDPRSVGVRGPELHTLGFLGIHPGTAFSVGYARHFSELAGRPHRVFAQRVPISLDDLGLLGYVYVNSSMFT